MAAAVSALVTGLYGDTLAAGEAQPVPEEEV
jgi:hypothetical protein